MLRNLLARLGGCCIRYTGLQAVVVTSAILLVALVLTFAPGTPSAYSSGKSSPSQTDRQAQIAAAFQHAWDGYAKYCFGNDTLHPVSNTCDDEYGGYGATALDSLSTAIMFGNEAVVLQILEFIATQDWNVVKGGTEVQVFEVTIRHLAGMISAWDLLNGPFSHMAKTTNLRQALYRKMIDLGDILSCAFSGSSGVPHEWVDPTSCQTDQGTTNTVSGIGTTILEFARLSNITGNNSYVNLAQKAEEYLLRPVILSGEPYPGLLGSSVSVDDGEIVDSMGSWGSYSDSFYEYLLKAYIYDSDLYDFYLDRWLAAVDSTIRSIGSHPYGHPNLTLLPSWNGADIGSSMESLSWFAGGNFILGGMITNNQTVLDYGLSVADTAGVVYNMTATGLGGEFISFNTTCNASIPCNPNDSMRVSDGRYLLRPEVLETWYYAYRATRDEKYRDWSWAVFEAINRYCRTDSGFSGIDDVNAVNGGEKDDIQESFLLAEVLKYVFLIHLDDDDAPYQVQDSRTGVKNTWVYNTEAHPLHIGGPPT